MYSIPVIGFCGYSGSGKTTLIERVIHALKQRGLRLAVIKHDGHDFEMDSPGKDSHRFAMAGADQTIVCSATKTASILYSGQSLDEMIRQIHGVDLILIEGFKNESIPQIGIYRKDSLKELPHPAEHFLAIATDTPLNTATPQFNINDIEHITEFIMEQTKDFTHFNEEGRAKMVDVGDKAITCRTAVAGARVYVNKDTFKLIQSGGMKKGDVLTVAQIAGIMGAKRTPELIPMCHPVPMDGINLTLSLDENRCCVDIRATASCTGRTGVEMEALTAASTAALTVYDMCKAVQKDMLISDIRLISKTGGIHGDFFREE